MTRTFLTSAALCLAVALPARARGDLITYNGTFDVQFALPGVPADLSGSFSFRFDPSTVTGVGHEIFTASLDSLTLTPDTIGATTFTTANTGVEIDFNNGAFDFVALGGTVSGIPNVVSGTDDFGVAFAGPALGSASYELAVASSAPPFDGIGNSTGGSGSVTAAGPAVPEPSTLAVAAAGALALLAHRRLRRGRA